MVCTANHAMEDLQHRIVDFSKYCSSHCHVKLKDSGAEGTVITERKEN